MLLSSIFLERVAFDAEVQKRACVERYMQEKIKNPTTAQVRQTACGSACVLPFTPLKT